MQIKIGEHELDFKMTALAVEMLEDKYDKSLDEIFTEDAKFKAKEVSFILHAMANTDMDLGDFKRLLAKHYTYEETINLLTKVFKGPNAEAATENEQSNGPQDSK